MERLPVKQAILERYLTQSNTTTKGQTSLQSQNENQWQIRLQFRMENLHNSLQQQNSAEIIRYYKVHFQYFLYVELFKAVELKFCMYI
jgi:hypothetical protein